MTKRKLIISLLIFLIYAGALGVLAAPIWLMRQAVAKSSLSVGIG